MVQRLLIGWRTDWPGPFTDEIHFIHVQFIQRYNVWGIIPILV